MITLVSIEFFCYIHIVLEIKITLTSKKMLDLILTFRILDLILVNGIILTKNSEISNINIFLNKNIFIVNKNTSLLRNLNHILFMEI